jgi:1,4-alpha-glucan branching enzyme
VYGRKNKERKEIENDGKDKRKSKTKREAPIKKVQFDFQSPEALEVFLAGNFNNWDVSANSMKKDKKAIWKVNLSPCLLQIPLFLVKLLKANKITHMQKQ